MRIFNLLLLTELAPVGTARTLSASGWDSAAVGDAQDLVPTHERQQRGKGGGVLGAPQCYREKPQDIQNKVHPSKGAPSSG